MFWSFQCGQHTPDNKYLDQEFCLCVIVNSLFQTYWVCWLATWDTWMELETTFGLIPINGTSLMSADCSLACNQSSLKHDFSTLLGIMECKWKRESFYNHHVPLFSVFPRVYIRCMHHFFCIFLACTFASLSWSLLDLGKSAFQKPLYSFYCSS